MASQDGLVERELREAREREADYRARLTRHRTLALKLRAHAAQLRETLRHLSPSTANVERLLADVARLSGDALLTPRTSVWLFDDRRANLVCRFQLSPVSSAPVAGTRIPTAACPAYVAAVENATLGALAVDDARNDPRTRELGEYLRTHDVGALLDIPILGPGVVHGVVCHEHQNGPRAWQEEEIDFAIDVGALVALVLEAERRISAERLARGTEARYQHLVESLPVTVYSFDTRTGGLSYLSPRVVELGGRAADEYLVSGGVERWVAAIEADDREPVRRRLTGGLDEAFPPEIEYRIRLPDGERRFIRDTCAVVRDATGRPIAVQGTLADITALKSAEAARLEIERRYRSLLENVELLAAILDSSGRVEFVNECFVRMTGFSREEALGANGFDLVLPIDEERKAAKSDFVAGLRRGRLPRRFESTLQTRGGARRRILWTNTLVFGPDGAATGMCTLGLDITDRLLAETAQLELQKLESLGRLAAGVAHDFNNLLTVIGGAVDQLSGEAPSTAVQEISDAVQQASGLTRSLLAYARREPIAPRLLDADALIEATLPMMGKLLGPHLRLSHRLGARGTRVVMDETQLRQVLLNLIGNAADATRGVGSEIRVASGAVFLEADQARARGLVAEGTFLVITVADDGRGMSAEEQQRIFEPFATTKDRGQGTGLGLAICTSIVQRAGGFITVESEPGKGAAFRVHLPAVSGKEMVSDPGRGVPRPESVGQLGATVLLLEDNEPISKLVARALSEHGLTVFRAPDLAHADDIMACAPIRVVLADVHLPDGSGEAWARTLATRARPPKVVLLSGSVSGHEPGDFDAVLPKPFNLDTLVKTVVGLLKDPERGA